MMCRMLTQCMQAQEGYLVVHRCRSGELARMAMGRLAVQIAKHLQQAVLAAVCCHPLHDAACTL